MNFIAHVVPGLEHVAEAELRDVGAIITRSLRRFDERTSLILFSGELVPSDLLQLRTIEDIFVLAQEQRDVPWRRVGLQAIRASVAETKGLASAVTLALHTRQRRKGKVTFRVIARKSGEHLFRRVDLQRAVELAILDRFPSWRLVEDDAIIEVWAQLVGTELIVGLRLSDNEMRQRTWRKTSLPAALKPTIAAALVRLSEPKPDDTFLDPMCGSGTILIERALAGRYRQLLGGDINPEAVAAATENIGPRYKPIEIQQWDARSLPLANGSVSALVCNLPFGKQIGTPAEMRTLYPALLIEWTRVVSPGGRMVLLSSEQHMLRRSIERHPELAIVKRLRILVRGQEATAFVLHHNSDTS